MAQELQTKKEVYSTFLEKSSIKKQMEQVIGENHQRFISSTISLVGNNKDLAKCDPLSIYTTCLAGHVAGFDCSPTTGYFYAVPIKGRAEFWIGWKGLVQLARRTGKYKTINAIAIKEGEVIEVDEIKEIYNFKYNTDDDARRKSKTVGYYAIFVGNDGFTKEIYWTKDRMIDFANTYAKSFSKAIYTKLENGENVKDSWKYKDIPWYGDTDSQGCKTVLKQILNKWGELTIAEQRVMAMDTCVIDENLEPVYTEDNNSNYQKKKTNSANVDFASIKEDVARNNAKNENFKDITPKTCLDADATLAEVCTDLSNCTNLDELDEKRGLVYSTKRFHTFTKEEQEQYNQFCTKFRARLEK